MSGNKPAGQFPPGKSNVRWTVWSNAPKKPTVQLKASWFDKDKQKYVDKSSLFMEELERLITAGPEALECMRSLIEEIERQSALGSDSVPFEMPDSLGDDLDF